MQIHGFQKMTLLDYPQKVACTVFTAGCNLRCPFCHNALLVTDIQSADIIPEEEVLSTLQKRQGLLDGVCITGGEPLLQPDLAAFIRKIKAMGYAVKLDTNGTFPDRLKALVEEGLVDYVAMDIKNQPTRYSGTVGIENYDLTPIRESVQYLLSGVVDYEFRTTIVAEHHTVEDVAAIAEWIKGARRYYLQNFVDSGHLIGENLHPVATETLEEMRQTAAMWIENTEVRGA